MSLPQIRSGASRQIRTERRANRGLRGRRKRRKRSPGEKSVKKVPAVPLITPLVNPSQPPRAWFGVQVGTPKRPGTV